MSDTTKPTNIVDAIRQSGEMLSEMDRYMIQSQQTIQKGIIDNVPIIDIAVFAKNHLFALLSEDDDTSNYAYKQLASEVGGLYSAFEIWDARTKEKLFRVPGVSPTFNTVMTDVPSAVLISRFRDSQLAQFPAQVEHFANYYKGEMMRAMGFDKARERYHQGWLEITDFCGILTDEEEQFYAPYRERKNSTNSYEYWVNPLPMQEYIAKHGPVKLEGKRITSAKVSEVSSSTSIQPNLPQKPIFNEPTDDWE